MNHLENGSPGLNSTRCSRFTGTQRSGFSVAIISPLEQFLPDIVTAEPRHIPRTLLVRYATALVPSAVHTRVLPHIFAIRALAL